MGDGVIPSRGRRFFEGLRADLVENCLFHLMLSGAIIVGILLWLGQALFS